MSKPSHIAYVVSEPKEGSDKKPVWREIGATYLAGGMHQEAHQALAKYVERRPYDPEGLYHFGETLQQMGDSQRARELYKQCVTAVKTMPYYRRSEVSKWSRLAQTKLS